MSFTAQDFDCMMEGINPVSSLAVGVSGGPDSMALCWLLSGWAKSRDITIYAITVDHALRPESAQEAKDVGVSVENWPHVKHVTLRWEGAKPTTRILEEARAARYGLMRDYMRAQGILHLLIAHHQDDQAETFLTRLAKGSGLDGLAGMKKIQEHDGGTYLCRPLLAVSKQDLVDLCEAEGIPYTNDPTNENEKYLRPRLRAARAVLEEEGLTSKRLSVTAQRFARARSALETLSEELFGKALREKRDDGFMFDWDVLRASPEELILRVLLQTVDALKPGDDYGPRMEKMENLLTRILNEDGFKSATLGGCLFAIDRKNGTLWVGNE